MDERAAAALMAEALGQHRRGAWAQAMAAYRRVLAAFPRHFDARHLLGVALRQAGDARAGAAEIGAALDLDPAQPAAWCNLGAACQDLGQPEEALAAYDRALALKPAYPMALANSGNALRRLGRWPEAVARYEAALALQPRYPEALCNLGVALHEQGRHADALDAFDAALALQPGSPEAWCGRGVARQALGELASAAQDYERALDLAPAHAEALANLAGIRVRCGEPEQALDLAERALAARAAYAPAALQRANALRSLGRGSEAAEAYRAARAAGADAAFTTYMLATLGAEPMPAAPPPAYVAALFDQYAARFDAHLQDGLGYDTPRLLAALLGRHAPAPCAIVDAGCGTGLCGPLLRPLATHLAGVDLSRAMLARAAERGVYDELACAELVTWLGAARAGAIVAADVLVYLGDLAPFFAAAARALRDGGLLALSVETARDGSEYTLGPGGRYAHGRDYLEAQAAAHGFEPVELEDAVLRREGSGIVHGTLALLRKAGGAILSG
jgi:predicted TPR repeat methyltransferase